MRLTVFTCSCSCLRFWEVHNLICFLAKIVVCVRDGDYDTIPLYNGQALISCRWHTQHLSRFRRQKKLPHNYTMTNTLWHQTDGCAELCVWPEAVSVVACCLMLFYPQNTHWMLCSSFFALYLCHFFLVMLIRYSLWCIATYSAASIFLPKGFQKSLCSCIIWGMNQTKQIPGESQSYELWFDAKYMKIYLQCKVSIGMRERTTITSRTVNEKTNKKN